MDTLQLISLFSSIVSAVLGIIAIWLSVVFYKMSTTLAETTREAAKGIGASVERLEKLFDKLYADTFSMMKDTVSDMRKHIWPEDASAESKIAEESERKADEKVDRLKNDISSDISKLLERQKITDARLSAVTNEMRGIVDKAINASRRAEVEARDETIRELILRRFHNLNRKGETSIRASDIVERLSPDVRPQRVVTELEKMREEGLLSWEGGGLGPDTKILIRL